jgi:hypothetical protein
MLYVTSECMHHVQSKVPRSSIYDLLASANAIVHGTVAVLLAES